MKLVAIKRLFDFIVSLLLLIFFSPIMLCVMFILALSIKGPIFFNQLRPGQYGKPFKMYKFCTMRELVDENGALLADEFRLTRIGKVLRSTSIDELPELWNVLIGDMSLVGPRPLLMEYIPLYSDIQFRRHEVKPGITGWAQINGRNTISWEEKFNLDVWYVDNQSLFLDIKILITTIKKVLTRDGITANGHATIEKFKGNFS